MKIVSFGDKVEGMSHGIQQAFDLISSLFSYCKVVEPLWSLTAHEGAKIYLDSSPVVDVFFAHRSFKTAPSFWTKKHLYIRCFMAKSMACFAGKT